MRNMKKLNLKYIFLIGFLFAVTNINAQTVEVKEQIKPQKAWEIGIGASMFNFSRIDFTDFQKYNDKYKFGMHLRHTTLGPHLYIARELSTHFYIDIQGNLSFTKQYVDGKSKLKTAMMVGPGLQWRLGEYFGSKYVDPFLRVGVNYMKKDFDMMYTGTEGVLPEEATWLLKNLYNKSGADRNHLMPIALGGGLNAWLNDRVGIGLQGDWLIMPYKNVANSAQGTARIIWRIGGKSKKSQPEIQYINVDRVVQGEPQIVEKIVEKIIEIPAAVTETPAPEICELFNEIFFEFDKSNIRPECDETLDKIADYMKNHSSKKFLVTGYTDARGSAEYNLALSRRRAAAVISALEERGVPTSIIKSRGVGKKISYAPVNESNIVREGDRKVAVEIIRNNDYWNFMPKRDY